MKTLIRIIKKQQKVFTSKALTYSKYGVFWFQVGLFIPPLEGEESF